MDYDPLPAVDRSAAAARPTTRCCSPTVGTNVAAHFGDASKLEPTCSTAARSWSPGRSSNQRVAPAPMEGRAGAAAWGEDGRLTAWIPNQGAQGTRARLAAMLGLDPAEVRVITPDVGGGFGAKFGADPEHGLVCLAAQRLGRPARWVETRIENLVGDDPRPGAAADGHDRRAPRRDGAGLPAGDPPGLRRLPQDRHDPAVAHDFDGAGPVRHRAGRVGRRRGA